MNSTIKKTPYETGTVTVVQSDTIKNTDQGRWEKIGDVVALHISICSLTDNSVKYGHGTTLLQGCPKPRYNIYFTLENMEKQDKSYRVVLKTDGTISVYWDSIVIPPNGYAMIGNVTYAWGGVKRPLALPLLPASIGGGRRERKYDLSAKPCRLVFDFKNGKRNISKCYVYNERSRGGNCIDYTERCFVKHICDCKQEQQRRHRRTENPGTGCYNLIGKLFVYTNAGSMVKSYSAIECGNFVTGKAVKAA